MRKVKCRVTGKIGTSEIFYKAPNGKYYENEEIYKKYISEKNYYEKIFTLINSEVLKNSYTRSNSFIGKLIKESNLSSKEIYDAISEQKEYLIEHLESISNTNYTAKIVSIFSISTKRLKYISYAGSYEIRNIKTNAVYIGESINIFERFVKHTSDLYNNTHHCKALQDLFNQNNDIAEFKITPLFMFKVINNDKKIIKEETLYLESAFYLIAKSNQEDILNTINPYVALKEGSVTLKEYDIDCKNVLKLLYEDKYDILPNILKKRIRKNLQEDFSMIKDLTNTISTDRQIQINEVTDKTKIAIKENVVQKNKEKSNDNYFRISNILDECKANDYIPQNADYNKVRNILVENNLISINENNCTVATEYALTNNLYVISDTKIRKGELVQNYYITPKGKNIIVDILKNHPNKENLSYITNEQRNY